MHCKKVLFVYCCCATDDLIQELLHLVESGVHAADARSTYLELRASQLYPTAATRFCQSDFGACGGFWVLYGGRERKYFLVPRRALIR